MVSDITNICAFRDLFRIVRSWNLFWMLFIFRCIRRALLEFCLSEKKMKKQSGEMEKRGGGALGGHVFKAIAVLLGY